MYRAREKQMSIYDYLPPYHGELCNANRWVRLADAIDCAYQLLCACTTRVVRL